MKLSSRPEYRSWIEMRRRCSNPTRPEWARYGGRGIRVCERWESSFDDFISDMGPRPSSRHSLDRIDNDGNYEPTNCRWATAEEQARNRRTNVVLATGEIQADAAARLGITPRALTGRRAAGWTPGEVVGSERRRARGERCGSAKLTSEAVSSIRKLRASGVAVVEIATAFGVHRNTIQNVLAGRYWTHVG